jgi:hypothetical protein
MSYLEIRAAAEGQVFRAVSDLEGSVYILGDIVLERDGEVD